MLKKIIFTSTLICCVCVLPSYTNICAKQDNVCIKAGVSKCGVPATAVQPVRRAHGGLEVFALEVMSIQL